VVLIMADGGSRLREFLVELKRRRVYRVAVVYVVVGLGVLGAAEVILDPLGLGALRAYIVILVLLGFPIALVLAWAYELRPEEPRERVLTTTPLSEATETERKKSIVVLPFDNLSPDPGDAYLSDGLTEEITTDLSHLGSLRVISRSSAMALKGTQKDVRTIARELNVQYVLEGSVRKAAGDLRITAQLIDAHADEHLWAEKYSGSMEDVFAMQEQVSRSIVDALELQLTPHEERRLVERPLENLQAYECYLRARSLIWLLSEESQDRALELIDRGLEIVGDNDLLYAAQGLIYYHQVDQMNKPPETYADLLKQARACADRALAINPSSAPAHALQGFVSFASGESQDSLRHFSSALHLDPNSAEAHLVLGYWRAAEGRELGLARRFLEKVAEIDPLMPMNKGALGWLHWFNGDFNAALDVWRDWQRQLEEVKSPYRIFLAYLHAADGNVGEAVRLIDQTRSDSPQHILTALGLLLKHGWLGEKEQALAAVTERLEQAVWWDDIWSLLLAGGYAQIGENERAIHWLDHTIDYGIWNVRYFSERDPFLAKLRSDERFAPLMEKARRLSESLGGE
jgi:TolB-like protein